jgi:hypothetical protein
VVPPSGPSERLLGKLLTLFSWDIGGELIHPRLGSFPFKVNFNALKGNFYLQTGEGKLEAFWNEEARVVKFSHAPLSIFPTFPEGEINGEWVESRGCDGAIFVTSSDGKNWSLKGLGETALFEGEGLSLEGNLSLSFSPGESPLVKLSQGKGTLDLLGHQCHLEEVLFETHQNQIQGILSLEEFFSPFDGLHFLKGRGSFSFDLSNRKLDGRDFEGLFDLQGNERRFLITTWDWEDNGATFEAWIEQEGLLRGSFLHHPEKNIVHFYEGSSIGGVDFGPLRLSWEAAKGSERLEGSLRGEFVPLFQKLVAWHSIPLDWRLPLVEGIFEGEILLSREGGECFLFGRDLKIEAYPIASASFDFSLKEGAFILKEGKIEELSFAFDALRNERGWDFPYFAAAWRDLLQIDGKGTQDQQSIDLTLEKFRADFQLFEAVPHVQPYLHDWDVRGMLSGSGEVHQRDGKWSALLNVKGEEIFTKEKSFPFSKETHLYFDERDPNIYVSGGEFFWDGHLLSLDSGTILFSEGIFQGTVENPIVGKIIWKKPLAEPLTLFFQPKTLPHQVSMLIEEGGKIQGTYGHGISFECQLKQGGKGDGKVFFSNVPVPPLTLESPLPLEAAWVFPSNGSLPFSFTEEKIEIKQGGELFSQGKGIRYEKIEGTISWEGELDLHLFPKAARLPLYWLEKGEIALGGSLQDPKFEVRWR